MGKIGCKAMLLLGSIMVLGGTAQAQYLRSSYFMEGTSARLQCNLPRGILICRLLGLLICQPLLMC